MRTKSTITILALFCIVLGVIAVSFNLYPVMTTLGIGAVLLGFATFFGWLIAGVISGHDAGVS